MKKNRVSTLQGVGKILMRLGMIAALVALVVAGSTVATGCAIDADDPVLGTTAQGATIDIDPSKICWDTVRTVPDGYKMVADPENNRWNFVPDADEVTTSAMRALEFADDGGGCACKCTSGSGCNPTKLSGSECGCYMTGDCNACARK